MSPQLLIAALLVTLGVGQVLGADNRTRPMDPSANLIQAIGGLPDAAFLQRDEAAVASLPGRAARAGLQGVVIGAPRRVDLRAGQSFSALVLSGRTASRSQRLPWLDNAILLATDVDRGQLFAEQAFRPNPDKAPPDPPKSGQRMQAPNAPAPSSVSPIPPLPEPSSAGTAWLDVPFVLSLPRQTMRLALRVVYFDQVSNAVMVEQLGEGDAAGPTPMNEVQALFARLAAAGQSPQRLPSFSRHPATPPAPPAPGIALTLGQLGQPGAPVPLHVAMRLTMTRPMTIDPAQVQAEPPPTFVRYGPPKALVRAAVLLVRPNDNQPHVVPVAFPIWTDRVPLEGETIEAAFSIDLASLLPPAALQPGAQVYVLAGSHLAGPVGLGR